MKLTRENLKLFEATSDESRPALAGLHIREGWIEAADGFMLIRQKLNEDQEYPDDAFLSNEHKGLLRAISRSGFPEEQAKSILESLFESGAEIRFPDTGAVIRIEEDFEPTFEIHINLVRLLQLIMALGITAKRSYHSSRAILRFRGAARALEVLLLRYEEVVGRALLMPMHSEEFIKKYPARPKEEAKPD